MKMKHANDGEAHHSLEGKTKPVETTTRLQLEETRTYGEEWRADSTISRFPQRHASQNVKILSSSPEDAKDDPVT